MTGEVSIGVIQSNLRSAGLTRSDLLDWLSNR